MGFRQAIATCLRKYFTFGGRARRSEYWFFVLFVVLGQIALGVVDAAAFATEAGQTGPLTGLFSLLTLVPLLAAGWRRMHDTGRSGLFLLYPLIVMVGISSFVAFTGQLGALGGQGMVPAFEGLLGLVFFGAVIVLFLSPLLVLWWLTRPTEPRENRWGPVPD